VSNILLAAKGGTTADQSSIDALGDQVVRSLGSTQITASRDTGPNIGDATRWLRGTATESSGGITVRFEVHIVLFSVGNDVATVLTFNIEGFGTQTDTVRYANIVLGRMRG